MLCGKNVRNVVCVLSALLGVALLAVPAMADVMVVTNGSFEGPAGTWNPISGVGDTMDWDNAPTGWTVDGSNPSRIRPAAPSLVYPAPAGGITLYTIDVNPNGASNSSIHQNIGTITVGETYRFDATLYSHYEGAPSVYRISFYDVTASKELAAITQANFDPSALGTMKSMPAFFSYTAKANEVNNGDTMRLILATTAGATAQRTGIDVITVTTTAAPEPGTLALLATALTGLLAYAWRRRK